MTLNTSPPLRQIPRKIQRHYNILLLQWRGTLRACQLDGLVRIAFLYVGLQRLGPRAAAAFDFHWHDLAGRIRDNEFNLGARIVP